MHVSSEDHRVLGIQSVEPVSTSNALRHVGEISTFDDNPLTWQDNDYRLSSASPRVDAADNAAVLAGIETDLGGAPRGEGGQAFVRR